MQCKIKTIAVVTALLVGTTGVAFAQGGSTDAKGNAMGSQNVSSTGAGSMSKGKMHSSMKHSKKHMSKSSMMKKNSE